MINKLRKYFYIIFSKIKTRIFPFAVINPATQEVKIKNILALRDEIDARTFVETGTYRGDMVEAVKKEFDKIYSIEIGQELAVSAQKRFANTASSCPISIE